MSLLDKWLSKKGIKDLNDLNAEERATYNSYKLTLTGKNVSIKDLEAFCESQAKLIESKLGFFNENPKYDHYLKACIHIYLTLLQAINAPKIEREHLEKFLISIINEQ